MRNANGRWATGHSGNPSGIRRRAPVEVARLRHALFGAVSKSDVEEIVRGLVHAAKGGEVAAARLVLAYVVGVPKGEHDADEAEREQEQAKLDRAADALSSRTNRETAEMFRDAAQRYAALPPDEPAAKSVHSLEERIAMARADLAELEAELAQQRRNASHG